MVKKLLLIPAVAVLATAGAAFAAGLGVDTNSAPIQVGESFNLSCADGQAVVQAWGYDDTSGRVAYATVELPANNDCAGGRLYATPLGAGHQAIGAAGSAAIVAGQTVYTLVFGSSDGTQRAADEQMPLASQLEGIRVAIDQGFQAGAGLE